MLNTWLLSPNHFHLFVLRSDILLYGISALNTVVRTPSAASSISCQAYIGFIPTVRALSKNENMLYRVLQDFTLILQGNISEDIP
jgi:hypothetical protein